MEPRGCRPPQSHPPLGTSAACWGAGRGDRAGRGPENWTSREGSATCQGPWLRHKAADVAVFGETRPHCARLSPTQPSPGWEQPQTASQSTKYTICFHCANDCCLLGPSRSRDLSQGSVESRVQGGVLACPWQPQLGGPGFLPATPRPWTSVYPCARGPGCVW